MTSAGLYEQSSTSSQVPDTPIQGLLHCVSLHWAPRFVLEETGDGRRGGEKKSFPSASWEAHTLVN